MHKNEVKLLIVGSKKIWAIENLYIKYLKELRIEAEIFPIHDLFYDYYYKSFAHKVLFKINSTLVYKRLNRDLLKFAFSNCFDIVWVFKGMEVYPETLSVLKSKGHRLVNYNPDHPFYFSGKGSGNKNVADSIGLYDLHLCYNSSVMKRIQSEYNIPCAYLPFGYVPRGPLIPSEADELLKVCFIGNPDTIRSKIIQSLIDRGLPVDVYGNDWRSFIHPKENTGIFDAIYQDEFARVAPGYRIQLNIFRDHNEGSHNMRTFEMPGLGCIMIAPKSPEHDTFFENEKEAFFYDSAESLFSIISKILNLSYSDCLKIRQKAMQRSVDCGYDYKSRTRQALTSMDKIINN